MNAADAIPILESLGLTQNDIAASLRARGVRGKRGFCGQCPLARLLRSDWCPDACVGESYLWDNAGAGLHEVAPDSHRPLSDAHNHHALRDFIIAFDCGHYPDLVASEEP